MTPDRCACEERLLAALAAGNVAEDLRAHAEECSICRDAESVWRYLQTVADGERDTPLPSPGVLWWMAQLAERRAKAERSVAVINVVQKAAVLFAMVAIAVCCAVYSPLWIDKLRPLLLLTSATLLGILVFAAALLFWPPRDPNRS